LDARGYLVADWKIVEVLLCKSVDLRLSFQCMTLLLSYGNRSDQKQELRF
jgi:hypothetical protein